MTLIKFRPTTGIDDTHSVQEKDAVANSPNGATGFIATSTDGYSFFYQAVFVRFDLLGFPAGGTVLGVKAEWTSGGTSSLLSSDSIAIGFLLDDGLWSSSNRFGTSSYAQRQDLPFAEWADGFHTDDTVWINGSRGGTTGKISATTTNSIWDIGDGTGVGTPLMTATGLAAHLQLAIDDQGIDDPLVALHAYRDFNGLNAGGPNVRTRNTASAFQYPELWVSFTPRVPSGVFTVVPQAQLVNGTMQVTINGVFTDYVGKEAGTTATWFSSLEGLLVTGPNFVEQDLRVGVHNFTVTAKSRALQSDQDETDYDNSPTSEGVFAGGSGYAVNDRITMADGLVVDVTSVNSGVVDGFTTSGPSGGIVDRVLIAQTGVVPAGGTGFTITPGPDNAEQQIGTQFFTITVYDGATDIPAAITAATVAGDPNSSLQIAGGILSAGAGGGSGEKGIAVIDDLVIL